MAIVQDFTELRVFKEAESVDSKIWAMRANIQREDMATWKQINRSSGSISDNIAEGFGRGSRGEFKTFLGYSLGSACEVRSQLRRLKRREIISDEIVNHLINRVTRLERSLKNMIISIRDSDIKGFRHQASTVNEVPLPFPKLPDIDTLPF